MPTGEPDKMLDKDIERELKRLRQTVSSGKVGTPNIYVRIAELEAEQRSRLGVMNAKKWAKFHIYILAEQATDEVVSKLHRVIRDDYHGKMNYIEDVELSEQQIDEEG